jgi:hypothetical protein
MVEVMSFGDRTEEPLVRDAVGLKHAAAGPAWYPEGDAAVAVARAVSDPDPVTVDVDGVRQQPVAEVEVR